MKTLRKVLRKHLRDMLWFCACALFAAICFLLGTIHQFEKMKIVKDPYIIYDNLEIRQLDNKGIYGIVSEKYLEEFVGYKIQPPFSDSEK